MYHDSELRPGIIRTAAAMVVCVLASLPTLTRLHDRLSEHDDVRAFRLSKNLERPHEKNVATSLEPIRPAFVTRHDSTRRHVVAVAILPKTRGLDSSLDSRAPPVR